MSSSSGSSGTYHRFIGDASEQKTSDPDNSVELDHPDNATVSYDLNRVEEGKCRVDSDPGDAVSSNVHHEVSSNACSVSQNLKVETIWDVCGYKEVLHRSDNDQMSQLEKMLEDRVSIEFKYSEYLTKWASFWCKTIACRSEDESFKEPWLSFTDEAQALSKIHHKIGNSLTAACTDLSDWQHKYYKKSNTLRKIEKAFKSAQEPWVDRLKYMKRRQEAYYSACKEWTKIKNQMKQHSASEQKRKWGQKEKKAYEYMLKNEDKYRRALDVLKADKEPYQREMIHQFSLAQDFEKTRLTFLKSVMLTTCGRINAAAYPEYTAAYARLENLISETSVDDCLAAFKRKKGTGVPFPNIDFEAYNPVNE